MPTYLERYLAGEHEPVWSELIALGPAVRQPPLLSDAWAVSCEIATRVRTNVGMLIPRSQALGYRFGAGVHGSYRGPFVPADPRLPSRLVAFEADATSLPLILHAFCSMVGNVDFRGTPPPGWQGYHDELQLDLDGMAEALDDWGDYEDDRGNLYLPIGLFDCPLHKRNCSGIGAVGMILPMKTVDAPLMLDVFMQADSLVAYLRKSILQCGGFPGILDEHQPATITHLDTLTAGLIAF